MSIDMFHEVHGEGFPTILLHGGIGATETFGDVLPRLAERRQVIAPHLQGHGRTPDVDRPLRAEDLGDDVAALARALGHEQVDLVGYSFGGGAAIQCAIRHPALVRRLVVLGEPLHSDAWFPEVRAQLAQMEAMAPQIGPAVQAGPLGDLHPEVDFTALFAKMGELVAQPYDWTAAFAEVGCAVMLVMADADSFDPGHYLEVYRSLGGALRDPGLPDQGGEPHIAHELAIVPGVTHYDLLTGTPRTAEIIADFLDR
jgi:pimeloyl-ACP methyl ester carboxylesterase